jgi:D-tyrosyl-tRNA(Tyr) deacylase
MRVVLQRALRASATLDDQIVASIGPGLLLFVGLHREDEANIVRSMASKLANLRVFEDGESKFGRSLLDEGGSVLTISQFTLCGDTSRGRRPSFSNRAPMSLASELYDGFVEELRGIGVPVQQGPFAARLVVDVRNWGPFTMVVDSKRP